MTLLELDLHIPSAAQAQTNCAQAPRWGGNLFFKCVSLPVRRLDAQLRTAEVIGNDCVCECVGAAGNGTDPVWRARRRRICLYAVWAGGCGCGGLGADEIGRA